MTTNKFFGQSTASVLGMGLLCGFAMASVQGCDDGGPLGNLAEQCGLVCSSEGIIEGNASISGVASVDAFFGAVIDVRSAALNISGSFRAELEGMAADLGLTGYAELSTADLAAQVKGAIDAKISGAVQGSLTIKFQPAKCEADIEVTAKAAAECDVEADPGMIEAKCEGSCQVSAEATAECEPGTLRCEGTAPNFECSGECSGSCQLEAAAECSGSCNGSCDGTCTACAGGDCDTTGSVTANCAGQCMGMCQGECKLEAAGSCSGRCEGSCSYTPPAASCEGSTPHCDVSASASAKCEGKCEANVTPPMVKAECQASVEAKAKAEVVCTPPSLTVDFQFAASLDADGRAEFKAWLEGFKARFSAMLAIRAKGDILVEAIAGLTASASGAVSGAVEAGADAAAEGDLKVAIGLGCAADQLPLVADALGEAGGELSASADAFVMISSSVGG